MIAGLVAKYDAIAFRLRLTHQGTGSIDASAGLLAWCVRPFPAETPLPTYLSITLARNTDAPHTIAYVFLLNPATDTVQPVWSDTVAADVDWEIEVRLLNPRWYARGTGAPYWECRIDGVQVYRDGIQVYGDTDSRVYAEGYFAPAGLPLLGLPPKLDVYLVGQGDSVSHTATATGGYRFALGGQWYAFPVVFPPITGWHADAYPCGTCVPPFAMPSASDSWTVSVTHVYNFNRTRGGPSGCILGSSHHTRSEVRTVAYVLPDCPRAYIPLSTEPIRVLADKLDQPSARRHAYYESNYYRWRSVPPCAYATICSDNHDTYDTQYAQSPASTTVIDQSASLDPPTLYAPFEVHAACESINTYQIDVECDPCEVFRENPPPDNWEARALLRYPDMDGLAPGYYEPHAYSSDTPYQIARYVNCWANAHWVHFLRFDDWPLGVPLQPVSKLDYWQPLQQQWLYHPSLPPTQATRQRNMLYLEPLGVSPYRDWIGGVLMPYPTLWVGACRFDVLSGDALTTVATTQTSAPRWTAQNASLTFTAGGIMVSPTASPSVLTFDLTDFETHPYLYPALADAVRIAITGVYTNVEVALLNFEGDAVPLAADPSDGTLYRYQSANDSVYAGSWAQSYAAQLTDYLETPFDLSPQGRSSAISGDAARRTLYEMLGNTSPAQLRITVHQDAPSLYVLAYPIFYRDARDAKAYPETAHAQAVVDGTHLWRFGVLEYQLASETPDLRPAHVGATVYDALCLRNHLLRAASYQTDVLAIASAIYDEIEWTGQYADLRMDTRAFVLPFKRTDNIRICCVNAWREVPPLASLPRRKRDAALAETGDWGQWAYLLSPIHRYYVAMADALHLYRAQYDNAGDETAREQWTELHEMLGRAVITRHDRALNNDEVIWDWAGNLIHSPRWIVARGLNHQDLARATPYHGYSGVVVAKPPVPTGSVLALDSRRQWLYWGREDALTAHHQISYAQWFAKQYPGAIVRGLAYDPRAQALLIVLDADALRLLVSRDGGNTGGVVMTLSAETLIAEPISPLGLWVAIYKDSTGVKRVESLDYGATWSAPVAVVLDGVAMTATPLSLRYDSRAHRLVMAYRRDDGTYALADSRDTGYRFTTRLP